MHLHQRLAQNVAEWRAQGYPHAEYPAIAEILKYATLSESSSLRLLRRAQLRALETYWYLRLVEGTPHIFALYQRYYPGMEILGALGLDTQPLKDWLMREMFAGGSIESLWKHIRTDADFVKQHDLESVHETLALDYPSYILALAMGAGKTMLIGAIVATEFAMALEYPGNDCPFIQNALVFAPGLTILESLRELAEVRYDKLLPPRLYTPFAATYKLIFTREGEKDLPVIRGSRYNLVVTNTEKIRIQKRPYRHSTWTQLEYEHRMEQAEAEANLRLQAIASLPSLGVFSDEAHHTYGRDVGKDLKRVRQTVDYLHENTDVICVINTTGTPYYERQPLRDVVLWYGLSEGIRDNILKSVDNSIYAYDFDNQHADQFVAEVVRDFFTTYGDVRLPNGAPAKLALYFPQTKDLRDLRPVVEQTLLAMGYSTDMVLRNTSESSDAEIDAFNRLNDLAAPHRVILLVNKGTEGWNCPSLFACALARKLRTSQNFVLQAGTRCLRQIPGNPHKARIYLSMDNQGALDRQLQETYGETIAELNRAGADARTARIVVRKLDIPPLVVKKLIRHVVPQPRKEPLFLHLEKPAISVETALVRRVFTLAERGDSTSVMIQREEADATRVVVGPDLYAAAADLAAVYRLDALAVYREMKRLYRTNGLLGDGIVPETHLSDLRRQIEAQTCAYTIEEEQVEEAIALLKLDGFNAEIEGDTVVYTAEITYHKDKEDLLLSWRALLAQNPHGFGFHYDPYNFDSAPEKDYFGRVLDALNLHPDEVEDIYFTGALTDPRKTDFYVEYRGIDDRWHRYSPDFVIRRKDGKAFIVEIKAERERQHPVDGEAGRKALAVREWVDLNPDRLKYEMIFTGSDSVAFNAIQPVQEFVKEGE
jgi:hypothetical protein